MLDPYSEVQKEKQQKTYRILAAWAMTATITRHPRVLYT